MRREKGDPHNHGSVAHLASAGPVDAPGVVHAIQRHAGSASSTPRRHFVVEEVALGASRAVRSHRAHIQAVPRVDVLDRRRQTHRRVLQVVQRTLHQHVVGLEVRQQVVPQRLLRKYARIAQQNQAVSARTTSCQAG